MNHVVIGGRVERQEEFGGREIEREIGRKSGEAGRVGREEELRGWKSWEGGR